MSFDFSFNTPPTDNVAFMMAKKPELHFDYDEIKFAAHQRAFTVAKITQIDLLAEIQASLENAFVEGQTYAEWSKELKPTLQKHGWLGNVTVTKLETGEPKEIFVGAKRLKTIFFTNARTAYHQSRARQQYEDGNEFLRYVAIMDNRTRHEHAAMHGLILKKKDKFWETNYPPNGWNCRCRVDSYSQEDLDEFGWAESSPSKKLDIAEKDWAYDTRNLQGNSSDLQLIIKNKLEKYAKNEPAKKALKFLREQVKENRSMYERIKGFWNETKKLTQDEINGTKGKEYILIAFADERLQKELNTTAKAVRLSVETLATHFKHEDITPFDYALVRHLLVDKSTKIEKGNKDRHIVYFSKYGVNYRAVLKTTENHNEIYLQSLVTTKGTKGTNR